MDRRSFLRSVSGSTAGTVVASSDSFASAPAAGGSPPQFLSSGNRDRSNIQSNDLTAWAPSANQPWDVHTINHLYRRAGFGATLAEIKTASGKNFSDVVDALLDDSLLKGPNLPADPRHSDQWLHIAPYIGNDMTQINNQMMQYLTANMEIRRQWTVQMNQPLSMMRERMALFWMNHFVVESKKVYFPQLMYNYLSYFRKSAWGNFKQMVSDVTIQPAMLIYLDGILNAGTTPNENYAREVQELFTMGVFDKNGNANYTQADVEAVAHALTGWTVDYTAPAPNVLPISYDKTRHDSSLQMIYDGVKRQYNLTASGASMDMDLFDHMFDQRGSQIAWYICSKLYQYFVYHDISGTSERAVIDAMAALLIASKWELKPVISALLKSAHFFDEANIGAGIKSPYDYIIGVLRTFNIQIEELAAGSLYTYALGLSQELLDPPNVKGWPGYHNWISATTLPNRDVTIAYQLLINKSIAAPGTKDGYGNYHLPVNLPNDTDFLKWAQQFTNYSGTFDDMLNELATYLCAQTPSTTALKYIKGQFPPQTYEWPLLDDATKLSVLRTMTVAIMFLADYQLS